MPITHSDFGDEGPGNSDRAEWAEQALAVSCEETGLDMEIERQESVSDLMCNLGHYCEQCGLDFLELAAHAIAVWDAEKREEENDEANALYPEKKVFISLLFPI